MSNFIPRKFKNLKTDEIIDFEQVIQNNSISVILGEPASGKTYQLELYHKQHSNSVFIELMFIDNEDDITKDIELILLDSIDEALSKNESDKLLVRNLTRYIKKCQQINQNVKFIISCRYLEWKEMFESKLEDIDKDITVYSIEELNENDINLLLEQNNIEKDEFWKFIEDNHLKQLLQNILMTIHIINNFKNYNNQELKYFEIYEKIIEEHLLAETENERKEQLKKLSLNHMVQTSSSIATYMTLNRTRTVSIENLNQFANELYLVDGLEIIAEELEIIFDTALFSGTRKNIRFFHKSIQEYLTAYFINFKKLNTSTIKQIFAHDIGFYEEFEEVIIYLTNIEPNFFKYLVEFDPFIFRRHPYLSQDNQKALFIAMLNTLEKSEQKGWTKWTYIEYSTLVKFPLVSKIFLIDILNNSLNEKKINYVLWVYLVSLLEYNHSIELENILFRILDNIDSRKQCFNYIEAHHINNFSFNQRLFNLIIQEGFILENESHLYQHLFNIFYKKIDFIKLLILTEHIPIYSLQYSFLNEIELNDIIKWFNRVQEGKSDSPEIVSLLIFTIFKNYKQLTDKNICNQILNYISSKKSYHIKFNSLEYTINNDLLNFNDIKNLFWKYYFNQENSNKYKCETLKILHLYDINIEDLIDISKKYPIENYIEHYRCFRNHPKFKREDVHNFLMQNTKFKTYMENLWQRHKNDEIESQYKYKELETKIEKEKRDRLINYENALNTLKTKKDLITIYSFFSNHSNVYEKLASNLKDKYPIFIDLVKKEFDNDTSYLEIQENIIRNSFSDISFLFNDYFSSLSTTKLKTLKLSKQEYEKLFWHTMKVKNQNLIDDYFITISKNHIKWCIELIIELMNRAFQLSNHTSILDWSYYYIPLFKKLEVYNPQDLKAVIENSKHLIVHSSQKLERDKSTVIEIIAVDKNNYEFILELLLNDKENYIDYFESLLSIDINKAIEDFLKIYYPKEEQDYITFSTTNKSHSLTPIYKFSEYAILNINPIKRKYFKEIVGTLYDMHRYKDFDFLSDLSNKHIELILRNYFNFFKPFYYPKGGYTDNLYENMHKFINKLIVSLGEDTKYIVFLNQLISTSKGKLQTHCKRQLENLYNLQLQTRDFDNKYYKNIFNNYQDSQNRFFDYQQFKNDLIEISLLETEHRPSICKENEDETNDRFRKDLHLKGYSVSDQSRGGESQSSKSVGERDLVIRDKESGVAECIIEAFQLDKSDDTNKICTHYKKLFEKYDTAGNSDNFILVYVKCKNFQYLWEKYKKKDFFHNFLEDETKKENLKQGTTKANTMTIHHLFINFYSEKPST